jgi:N4-gp56 family major capsid protein
MTIQVVTAASGAEALSNAVRTRYIADYIDAMMMERVYDQIATPVGKDMSRLARGSSVTLNFISDMEPGTTAISETVDITPQTLVDGTTTLTPTSRAEALQSSELLLLQSYTPYGAERFKALGKSLMETLEILARDAATQGSVRYGASGVARASLSSACTSHRADDGLFTIVSTMLSTMKCPSFNWDGNAGWAAIMHPAAYHDIRRDGNVVSIAQYQKANIVLNHELGSIGPFKLVVSPWAKVFGGAGTDRTDVINTSFVSALSALDKTLKISTTTHLDTMGANIWWTIGSEETANTHYPKNERIWVVSYTTSVITFVGEGANGGLRFDHPTTDVARNAFSVYPIVFGGPESLAKVYQPSVGEYGTIVGPKQDGLADQFVSLAYKYYGGYGRIAENRLVRAEVSSSLDVLPA